MVNHGVAPPLFVLLLAIGTASASWPAIQQHTTTSGTRYGTVSHGSTTTSTLPKPTLIALTGAMSDTLGGNASHTPDPWYYANACEYLVPAGWLCASLDLPSHGAYRQPGEPEGIAGWRSAQGTATSSCAATDSNRSSRP